MEPVRRDLLVFAIVMVAVALFVWVDRIPAAQVPLGVAFFALAILTFVRPVVWPRPADTPDVPLWQKIWASIGLTLFGVAKIWPQYGYLSTAAVFCVFAPQILQVLRRYLGTDSDSVSQR